MSEIQKTWQGLIDGKISYSNFSESALVMAVNLTAETYDVIIGDREPLTNGVADPAKIYRGVKSSIPFSTMSFRVGEAVMVGYLAGDRNNPLVIGRSDNIIMDIEKVTINPAGFPTTPDIFIFDASNHRIKRHNGGPNFAFVTKVGSQGTTGHDLFSAPSHGTSDGTYLYHKADLTRLHKRRISDLNWIAEVSGNGSGNDQFSNIGGITTDGEHVYLTDCVPNNRVVKRRCLDLVYVAECPSPGSYYNQKITTDGIYIYVADFFEAAMEKRRCSDLSFVSSHAIEKIAGMVCDDQYLYTTHRGSTGNRGISKRRLSDLTQVLWLDLSGFGDPPTITNPGGISVDSTYVYLIGNDNVSAILKSDFSFINEIGSTGSGDNQFLYPGEVESGERIGFISPP